METGLCAIAYHVDIVLLLASEFVPLFEFGPVGKEPYRTSQICLAKSARSYENGGPSTGCIDWLDGANGL